MKVADKWKDYVVLATGDGYKLERWKDVILLRPDPQVIWGARTDMENYKGLNAKYIRSERTLLLFPFPSSPFYFFTLLLFYFLYSTGFVLGSLYIFICR